MDNFKQKLRAAHVFTLRVIIQLCFFKKSQELKPRQHSRAASPQRQCRYPVAEHEWRQCGNGIMWSQSGRCVQSSRGAGRAWERCLPEEPGSPRRDAQRTVNVRLPVQVIQFIEVLQSQSSFFWFCIADKLPLTPPVWDIWAETSTSKAQLKSC